MVINSVIRYFVVRCRSTICPGRIATNVGAYSVAFLKHVTVPPSLYEISSLQLNHKSHYAMIYALCYRLCPALACVLRATALGRSREVSLCATGPEVFSHLPKCTLKSWRARGLIWKAEVSCGWSALSSSDVFRGALSITFVFLMWCASEAASCPRTQTLNEDINL